MGDLVAFLMVALICMFLGYSCAEDNRCKERGGLPVEGKCIKYEEMKPAQ